MKRLLKLILYLLVFTANAQQDSTMSGVPTTIFAPDLLDQIRFSDCAHGHICCYSGCSCCWEMNRSQVYDTVRYNLSNGDQKIVIAERFGFAASHAPSKIQYQFIRKDSTVSPLYYDALITFHWFSSMSDGDLNSEEFKSMTSFEKGEKLVFKANNDHVLIDPNGYEVPIRYSTSKQVDEDLFRVSIIFNDRRIFGLTNAQGKKITTLSYTNIGEFGEDGIAISTDRLGRFGAINKAGEEVLPFNYMKLERVANGLYATYKETGYGLIDISGNRLTSNEYRSISPFSEGLAMAQKEKGIVYLDTTGKEVISLKYDWGREFSDGLAMVNANGKFGYINRQGKLVIDFTFDAGRNFCNGVAAVAIGQNYNTREWGLINKKGEFINNKRFNDILNFKGGIARTYINGQGYGYVDFKGNEVMNGEYTFNDYGTDSSWFNHGVMIRVQSRQYELINEEQDVVLTLSNYQSANFIQTNSGQMLPILQVVKMNGKRNLLHFTGEEILKKDYDVIGILFENLAYGSIDDQFYLIDLYSGKEVRKLTSGRITVLPDGVLMIDIGNYANQYLDARGNEIITY